uniref:Uncharacterized protein n=1 Tax=Rousettus aegyptiacus TaxID=9407 RepID=A0A7J8HSP2_ROUAE|nr:hypothetical protein HJG63_010902 [Rousettus aegyptiacus]
MTKLRPNVGLSQSCLEELWDKNPRLQSVTEWNVEHSTAIWVLIHNSWWCTDGPLRAVRCGVVSEHCTHLTCTWSVGDVAVAWRGKTQASNLHRPAATEDSDIPVRTQEHTNSCGFVFVRGNQQISYVFINLHV